MPDKAKPTFQQVVCSAPLVRDVFTDLPVLHRWWQVILLLHGKPRDPLLSGADRVRCVAQGFRFYAWLYRVLAMVFMALTGLLAALQGMGSDEVSAYWVGASCLGAIYLWIVSGLGYYGAEVYRQEQPQGISLLVSFMVMIVAFLSLFVAALSVAAHHLGWVANEINLISISALFLFGVGSYLIEIIYLTAQKQPSPPVIADIDTLHRG